MVWSSVQQKGTFLRVTCESHPTRITCLISQLFKIDRLLNGVHSIDLSTVWLSYWLIDLWFELTTSLSAFELFSIFVYDVWRGFYHLSPVMKKVFKYVIALFTAWSSECFHFAMRPTSLRSVQIKLHTQIGWCCITCYSCCSCYANLARIKGIHILSQS